MPFFKQGYGRVVPYMGALASVYGPKLPVYGPKKRSVSHRSHSNTIVTTKRSKRKRKTFTDKVLSTAPAKHFSFQPEVVPGGSMTHNTLYTMNVTTNVVRGVNDDQRIGDYIHLEALKLKGFFQTPVDNGAFNYRIIVGYSGEEFNNPGFGSGLGVNELFQPNTATAWTPNGIINPKTFTALYDETIEFNSNADNTSEITGFSVMVPLNQKFPYQSAGSVFGKMKNLYVVITGAVRGGVTGTTTIGNGLMSFDLIYKNL